MVHEHRQCNSGVRVLYWYSVLFVRILQNYCSLILNTIHNRKSTTQLLFTNSAYFLSYMFEVFFSIQNNIRGYYWHKVFFGRMASEVGKVKIDNFNDKDFEFWKMQIKDYLYQKNLHLPLTRVKSENTRKANWGLLDRQAFGAICLTLTQSVAFNIINEKITTGLTKVL